MVTRLQKENAVQGLIVSEALRNHQVLTHENGQLNDLCRETEAREKTLKGFVRILSNQIGALEERVRVAEGKRMEVKEMNKIAEENNKTLNEENSALYETIKAVWTSSGRGGLPSASGAKNEGVSTPT